MEIKEVKGCIVRLLDSLIPPALDAGGPSPLPCPTPSPDLPLLLSFLFSRLRAEDATSSCIVILEECVREVMETAFRTLQCDLTQKELAETVHFKTSHMPSSWNLLGQICSSPDSSHFLCILERFSQTLSGLISSYLSVSFQSIPLVRTPGESLQPHPLLATLEEVWQVWEQELISLVLELQFDSEDREWGLCLEIMGVGLVVGQLRTVLGREMGKGGNPSREEVSIIPGGSVKKLLRNLDQHFPSALYKKYLKLEAQEVGGAKELVSTLQGGLVLKVRLKLVVLVE